MSMKTHPYHGQTVYFGTKHAKGKVVCPLLDKLGVVCAEVAIDTDEFGTFSGEVERKGSIRETLRLKINAVFNLKPDARVAMASEGSFGPHPIIGLIQSDHEALMLVDRELGIEIYVDEISTDTNHAEIELGPHDDYRDFLNRVKFPSHAVIVKSKGISGVVFKGLTTNQSVEIAVKNSLVASPEKRVIVTTDMRASLNPTRMRAIEQLAHKLIERLSSFCPECESIGFWPVSAVSGLICSGCGMETEKVKGFIWGCTKCNYTEFRPREDGRVTADPKNCDFCNP